MPDKTSYDPYDTLHKFSLLLEKQINDFIYLWTDNNEFVKMSNVGSEIHSRYLETLKKNQEALANVLNLPTKSDVTNVSNLTIQVEEKIEALEEQIWGLHDSLNAQSKEIESVVKVSKEIIKLTKQLKTELVKTKKEQVDAKSLYTELQEMKLELIKLNDFTEEFNSFLEKNKTADQELSGGSNFK